MERGSALRHKEYWNDNQSYKGQVSAMSYEGYEQVICVNGHYSVVDCYMAENPCSVCNCAIAWDNPVDTTNGGEEGKIELKSLEKFIKSPAVVETCNLGHPHIMSNAVYKVPTRKQTDPLRTYSEDTLATNG